MMFIGGDDRKPWNARGIDQVLAAKLRVLLNDGPFFIGHRVFLLQGFCGNEKFADVMQHCRKPDFVKQLPFKQEHLCLSDIQHTDVGGVGISVSIEIAQRCQSDKKNALFGECLNCRSKAAFSVNGLPVGIQQVGKLEQLGFIRFVVKVERCNV